MTDVQLEQGYTRVANRLLAAIARAPWDSPSQTAVVLALVRMTYGLRRKDAPIGTSDWKSLTGLKDKTLRRALDTLQRNGVIRCVQEFDAAAQTPRVWRLEKRPTHWKRFAVGTADLDEAEAVAAEHLRETPPPTADPRGHGRPGVTDDQGSRMTPDPSPPVTPPPSPPVGGGSGSEPLSPNASRPAKERERKERKNPGVTGVSREGDGAPGAPGCGPTIRSIALLADEVLGYGGWGGELGAKHAETCGIIRRRWLGRGVSLDQVEAAIQGLRLLIDEGRVEWLEPEKPVDGLEVLVNNRAVVEGPDGSQMRDLFALSVERYYADTNTTQAGARRSGAEGLGRVNVSVGG